MFCNFSEVVLAVIYVTVKVLVQAHAYLLAILLSGNIALKNALA